MWQWNRPAASWFAVRERRHNRRPLWFRYGGDQRRAAFQLQQREHASGQAICYAPSPSCAARQKPGETRRVSVYLGSNAAQASASQTYVFWSSPNGGRMKCGEVLAAHEPNEPLAGMEPQGENEFGRRFEDTARSPNFWNLIDVWSRWPRTGDPTATVFGSFCAIF